MLTSVSLEFYSKCSIVCRVKMWVHVPSSATWQIHTFILMGKFFILMGKVATSQAGCEGWIWEGKWKSDLKQQKIYLFTQEAYLMSS